MTTDADAIKILICRKLVDYRNCVKAPAFKAMASAAAGGLCIIQWR